MDTAFQIVIGLVAFAALSLVALAVATDVYAAIFPQDDTTQHLADRIEYLACGGGFGADRDCPADRYARNVFLASTTSEDADERSKERMVIFEEPNQVIHVEEYRKDTSSVYLYFFEFEYESDYDQIVRRITQYTNPLESSAVCRTKVGEEITANDCVELEVEGVVIAAAKQELGTLAYTETEDKAPDEPTFSEEYYQGLYDDEQTYGAPVLKPTNPLDPSQAETQRPFFYLYLEYTPATQDEPARMLVTPYKEAYVQRAQSIS